MHTIRKITVFLFIIAVCGVFFGCSEKEFSESTDIELLANDLLENLQFEDELNLADDSVVEKLYGFENYEKAVVYISSGATAEEIAVFEFSDKNTAQEALEKVKNRVLEQKEDYKTYIPKEAAKLDNAVINQTGRYIVLCVSNDGNAFEIISKYTENK